jgi:hypothetical protein
MGEPTLTLGELERWALFGAHWRVVQISDDRVVVELCACTGEPVERRESRDATLIDYVASHAIAR